jgi:TorA maturation chaperone TorD
MGCRRATLRGNAYGLLGALLRAEPDAELLRQIGRLAAASEGTDDLGIGMALLGLAARTTSQAETETARFFRDLEQAQAAVFYRAVGRFGRAFLEFENRYLSMPA